MMLSRHCLSRSRTSNRRRRGGRFERSWWFGNRAVRSGLELSQDFGCRAAMAQATSMPACAIAAFFPDRSTDEIMPHPPRTPACAAGRAPARDISEQELSHVLQTS
jgi:hypothetical protein